MKTFDCILSRRSVRSYSSKPIETKYLNKIIQSAIWAPSGKNGQPWKFKIINDENTIEEISKLSRVSRWIKTAPCLIIVYLDKTRSYNYVKDIQSCGAAIQNMLLTSHDMNIGSCWIGELVEKADVINEILHINDSLELIAIVTLGYANSKITNVGRRDINKFLL